MPRSVVVTDNFNRADSTDLGASWDGSYTGRDNFQILTNKVRASGNSGVAVLESNNTAPNNDQYAIVKLATFGAGGDWVGPCVRMSAPATVNHYMVIARPGAGNTQLYRVDAGVLTSLALVANPGWVVGDTVELEIEGNVLTVFRNGATIGLTATDATYTTGRAGMTSAVPTGQQGNMELDDFEAGNMVAAVVGGGTSIIGTSRSGRAAGGRRWRGRGRAR